MLAAESLHVRLGRKDVLTGLSLEVMPGEIVGLVAPNGSGKTTLLRTLSGLLQPRRGTVLLDGKPLNTIPKKVRYRRLFFADASHCLFPNLTPREHLAFVHREWRSDITPRQVIDRLDMGWFEKLPVSRMSLGMKQLVVIGMAITSGAEHLLLDEPMNGLDPTNTEEVARLYRELRDEGIGLLLSSHILPNLDLMSDRIVYLQDGRITRSSTPGDGTTAASVYRELYSSVAR